VLSQIFREAGGGSNVEKKRLGGMASFNNFVKGGEVQGGKNFIKDLGLKIAGRGRERTLSEFLDLVTRNDPPFLGQGGNTACWQTP